MATVQGQVKWFNAEKGFGFIVPENGGGDIFVHFRSIEDNDQTLQEGQTVSFVIGQGRKGPQAESVVKQGGGGGGGQQGGYNQGGGGYQQGGYQQQQGGYNQGGYNQGGY